MPTWLKFKWVSNQLKIYWQAVKGRVSSLYEDIQHWILFPIPLKYDVNLDSEKQNLPRW